MNSSESELLCMRFTMKDQSLCFVRGIPKLPVSLNYFIRFTRQEQTLRFAKGIL